MEVHVKNWPKIDPRLNLPKCRLISKCIFGVFKFPPKNERKQVDLRFHSSKVEFLHSFFGGNVYLKKSFRLFLTFSRPKSSKCSSECDHCFEKINLKQFLKILGILFAYYISSVYEYKQSSGRCYSH